MRVFICGTLCPLTFVFSKMNLGEDGLLFFKAGDCCLLENLGNKRTMLSKILVLMLKRTDSGK